MRTPEDVQIALIAHLKAQATLVSLLTTNDEIKETQWQGTDFVYPAVRVENDILPSIDGCSPDTAEIVIYALSEKKSSKQCSQVAAEIARIFHNKSFTGTNGVRFVSVKVTRIPYPKQQEGQSIWQSPVQITAMVS